MIDGPRDTGHDLHAWGRDLFPICRSITGAGFRESLAYVKERLPGLAVREVSSGTQAFDWKVPEEWNIRAAYVEDLNGRRWIDFGWNNLHVVGYSVGIDKVMRKEELEQHLHSLPEQPTAIPYVTSYYERTWGFCVTQEQRDALPEGPFRVVIDADLIPGCLTYGELILEGEIEDEVLLSTYLCHPSMANNELSGPLVALGLARWLSGMDRRRLTYRVLFLPETIGSIVYLSRHLDELKSRVKAGWVLTCMGDDRTYSYLPTRQGNTLSDRVSRAALRDLDLEFIQYSFLDRGSDERQYCSPGVNLPVASLMRSKYGTYPEYHTSLDDMTLVSPAGLQGSLDLMSTVVGVLEENVIWQNTFPCEPQLGRRGLYPNQSTPTSGRSVRDMMNVLAHLDGSHDTVEVAELCGLRVEEAATYGRMLEEAGVIYRT